MKKPSFKIAKKSLSRFWSLLWCSEKDLTSQKYKILRMFFICDGELLSTKETIGLYEELEKEFHNELSKRYLDAQLEIALIDEYKRKRESQKINYAN